MIENGFEHKGMVVSLSIQENLAIKVSNYVKYNAK
jgi:hypothetical protein